MSKSIAFLFLFLLCSVLLNAQCSLTISSFPYSESFETSQGGWTSGGTLNDWAWGTPAKTVINTAGAGAKCWISGGLTPGHYAYGERAYVQSPCFDFTNLAHPYISFKIFWESEHIYDGSNLQYSTNNGSTWVNVGAVNEAANCLNANWYNTASINYLTTLATTKNGWSGNTQASSGNCNGGSGSNGWVVAKHCMSNLAGLPNVVFRFTFGAGTTCNDYDGIAFDDVHIEEAPAIAPDFSTACVNNPTYSFTDLSTTCPDTWSWNFGDAASGAGNTSSAQNPQHTFSAPGVYTVSLTASSACSGSFSVTHQVMVLGVTAVSTPIVCPGANSGSASATISPSGITPTIIWNTTPAQHTATINNLAAGTYTVSVTQAGSCAATASVTITSPAPFVHTISITPASCGNTNGTATVTETGGTSPYSYSWSSGGGTNATSLPLAGGNYSLTITDHNNCTDSVSLTIPNANGPSVNIDQILPASCSGSSNGSVTVITTGGTSPYHYSWSPIGPDAPVHPGLSSGSFSVTITDASGCTASLTGTVPSTSTISTTILPVNPTCAGLSNGSLDINVSGGSPPYSYLVGSTTQTTNHFNTLTAGYYPVTITDANGCTDTTHVAITAPMPLVIAVSNSGSNCGSQTNASLSASVSGGTPTYSYQWNNAQTTSTISQLASNTYTLTVTDMNNCSATTSAIVASNPDPLVVTIADTTIYAGSPVNLLANSNISGVSYAWSSTSGFTSNAASVVITPTVSGTYTVIATSPAGCTGSAQVNIAVNPTADIKIPNVFTPNGDGSNDAFMPLHTTNVQIVEFKVYSRWGELVHDNANQGWDGTYHSKPSASDAYIYMVKARNIANDSELPVQTGDFLLVR